MPTALITGVTGQVGGALVEPLQSIGAVVTADRNRLDLARPEHIASALDRIAPDLIVNPAGPGVSADAGTTQNVTIVAAQ